MEIILIEAITILINILQSYTLTDYIPGICISLMWGSMKPNNHQAHKPLDQYRDLLSAKDLANIFNVSMQTIYKEIKAGKFGVPIKIGRAYKIPKIHLLQRYFSD